MAKKKEQNLSAIKRKKFLKDNALFIVVFMVLAVLGVVVLLSGMMGSNSPQEIKHYGDDRIDLHFFHLSTCPHCHAQIRFHKTLLEQYPELNIIEYEIKSQTSRDAYSKLAIEIGGADPSNIATPTTFIGNRSNVGFGAPETSGQILIEMIEDEKARIAANWDESKVKTVDLQ